MLVLGPHALPQGMGSAPPPPRGRGSGARGPRAAACVWWVTGRPRGAVRRSAPCRMPRTLASRGRRARARGPAFRRGGASRGSRSPGPPFPRSPRGAAEPARRPRRPVRRRAGPRPARPPARRRDGAGRAGPRRRLPPAPSPAAAPPAAASGARPAMLLGLRGASGASENLPAPAPPTTVSAVRSYWRGSVLARPGRLFFFFVAAERPPGTIPHASFGCPPVELRGRPRRRIPPLLR